jgi:hypothetical protein
VVLQAKFSALQLDAKPLAAESASTLAVTEIPPSRGGSVFHRHSIRSGGPAIGMQLMSFMTSATTVAIAALWAGPGGALLVAPMAVAAFWSTLSRVASLGNGTLRQELAARLGVCADEEFVGLCKPENNSVAAKLLRFRLETDDNVGFLHLSGDRLTIRTEEGWLRISRDAVRRISLERFTELPYLQWISLEHYREETLHKLLICSRQGECMREYRDATLQLQGRLRQWYLEPYLREAMRGR